MNKKIKLMAVALLATISIAFAQTTQPEWKEMKAFHAIMSPIFHPAEAGNFVPLKTKSDSLLLIAKNWHAAPIPSDYQPKKTEETLAQLVKETSILHDAVLAQKSEKELMKLLTVAHDTFHKVAGECKKEGE
jgi:hypothetical protein